MIKKSIKNKIKEYFFMYPTSKLRVREIERNLKLPLPSIIRYCNELYKEDILSIYTIGNTHFYMASRSNTYLLEKNYTI